MHGAREHVDGGDGWPKRFPVINHGAVGGTVNNKMSWQPPHFFFFFVACAAFQSAQRPDCRQCYGPTVNEQQWKVEELWLTIALSKALSALAQGLVSARTPHLEASWAGSSSCIPSQQKQEADKL